MYNLKKLFLILVIAVIPNLLIFSQTYRVRFQIQGDDINSEISDKWESDDIITKQEAVEMLNKLWESLTPSQKDERDDAIQAARSYIGDSPTKGRSDQGSKSFQNSNRKVSNARIDVEINKGAAFSDDRHIVYLRIQGSDLSSNQSWGYDDKHILRKKVALDQLEQLWRNLSGQQQALRDDAYKQAQDFINSAGVNGIEGSSFTKEFMNSNANNDQKILIVIDRGAAFCD
jgi:hypothetical protein